MSTLPTTTRVGYLASLVEEKANFSNIAKNIEADAELIEKKQSNGFDIYQYQIGEDLLILITRDNIVIQTQLHSLGQEEINNVFQHVKLMAELYTLIREEAGIKYFIEKHSDIITAFGFELQDNNTQSVIFSQKEIPTN